MTHFMVVRTMSSEERLLQAVKELTEPHNNVERYTTHVGTTTVTLQHTVQMPSLLDQLATVQPGGGVEKGRSAPASRPQAHLHALDTLTEIDHESTAWVRELGGEDRGSTAGNLRALVGLSTGRNEQRDVASAAWGWRTRAAVITGWELPARTLANTCPVCATRGTLRIRLDVSTGTGTGFCLECRAVWDEEHIGLLAQHIREENREDDTQLGETA